MKWRLPKLAWTWRTALLSAVATWAFLLVVFSPGRICTPIMSAHCAVQAWSFLGDLVWLRGIDQWQALVAGLIAIVAAFIGGYYINKQIQQTANLDQDRIAREFEAVRAMMPIYLDKLVDHIIQCGGALKSLYRINMVGETPRQTDVPIFPPLPMDAATFLQSVVLRAPKRVRPPVIAILSEMQVFRARLDYLASRAVRPNSAAEIGEDEFDENIIQAADLYARCVALLPYARNQSEDLSTDGMVRCHYMTALNNMGFEHSEFPALVAKMGRKVAGSE